MRKTINILLLGGMGIQALAPATVVFATEGTNKYEQAVADAQAKVDALEEEKSELETQIAQLKQDLETLDASLDKEFEAQVGTEIESLKTTTTEKITQLSKQVSELNDTISSTNKRIETFENAITKNTTDLKKAKTTLTDAEKAVTSAQTALDKAEATMNIKKTDYDKAKKAYDDAIASNPEAVNIKQLQQEYEEAKTARDECDYMQGIYGFYDLLKEEHKDDKEVLANITKGENYLKNHTAKMHDGQKSFEGPIDTITYDMGQAKIDTTNPYNSAHIENVKESLDYMKEVADKRQADTTRFTDNTKNVRLLLNPWLMATSIRNVETHRQVLTRKDYPSTDHMISYNYATHLYAYKNVYENMDFSTQPWHSCVDAWYTDELECYIKNGNKPIPEYQASQGHQTGHYVTIMDETNVSFGGALSHRTLYDNKGQLIEGYATKGDFYIQNFAEENESTGSIPLDDTITLFNDWYTKAKEDYTALNTTYNEAKTAYEKATEAVSGLDDLETAMNKAKTAYDTAKTAYDKADTTLKSKQKAEQTAQKKVETLETQLNKDKAEKTTLQNTLKEAKATLKEAKDLLQSYRDVQGYLEDGTYKIAESDATKVPEELKDSYTAVQTKAQELYDALKGANSEYQTKKDEQVSLEKKLKEIVITMSQAKKVLNAEKTKLEAYKQSLNKEQVSATGGNKNTTTTNTSKGETGNTTDEKTNPNGTTKGIETGVGTLTILAPVIVATAGLGMVKATGKRRH